VLVRYYRLYRGTVIVSQQMIMSASQTSADRTAMKD
jgi:hypothetical protein